MIFNLVLILFSTYPWPLKPFDTAHGVSGTLGDGRGSVTDSRFHWGIDIPAGPGTNVFSITSGRAYHTQHHDGIYVGNYWYIHLENIIASGSQVVGILDNPLNPDRIGDVAGDHLHFQIGPSGGPFTNPLSYDGGPVGYTDNGMPIVWGSATAHWFWRSGSEGQTVQEVQSPLWGKIDIRTYCQDRQTSGGVNTTSGIYRLEWLVRNRNTGTAYGPYQTTVFPQVQPPNNGAPVLLVYDRHNYRTVSPFYYWVTNPIINNQVEDRYWNTKLRQGEDWNGLDARINAEAYFPDCNYRVWVMAYDILNNGGDTLNRQGAEDEDIIIDNFKPYVTRVQIEQEDRSVKYQAHWPTTPQSDYDLGQLIIDKDDDCKVGKLLTFLIEFSEDMKTDVLPTLQVQFPNRCSKTFNLSIDIRNNLDNILWLRNNKEV